MDLRWVIYVLLNRKFYFYFLLYYYSTCALHESLYQRSSRTLNVDFEFTFMTLQNESVGIGQTKVIALNLSQWVRKFALKHFTYRNYKNSSRSLQIRRQHLVTHATDRRRIPPNPHIKNIIHARPCPKHECHFAWCHL